MWCNLSKLEKLQFKQKQTKKGVCNGLVTAMWLVSYTKK